MLFDSADFTRAQQTLDRVRLDGPFSNQALLRAGSPAALKIVAGIAEVIAQRLASANAKLVELADRLESAEGATARPGERELIELQRKLQVWSF